MSNAVAAPRHAVQTPETLPSWARTGTEADGRPYIEVDARGGPPSIVTHTVAFPHGATVALYCSAMVKSTLLSGSSGYEGLGVAAQAMMRDGSSRDMRVIWQRRPELVGDIELWVRKQFSEYTEVHFIVQMPDGIAPDYMQISWIVRGYAGQVRYSDFQVRDHYRRYYEKQINAAQYTDLDEEQQLAPGFAASMWNGNRFDKTIFPIYLKTIDATIPEGAPVEFSIEGEVFSTYLQRGDGTFVPIYGGFCVKLRRREDGSPDWVKAEIPRTPQQFNPDRLSNVLNGIVQQTTRKTAIRAYNQMEILAFATPIWQNVNEITGGNISVATMLATITVDDSVRDGTG